MNTKLMNTNSIVNKGFDGWFRRDFLVVKSQPKFRSQQAAVSYQSASVFISLLFTASLVFLAAETACAASVSWSGAGVTDTNWSTAGNWSGLAAPGAADDVQFLDAGSSVSAGLPNNFVDNSFAGTIGSLRYANQNGFHTTVIAPVGRFCFQGKNYAFGSSEAGPVARRMFNRLTDIQYGRVPDPYGWTRLIEVAAAKTNPSPARV